MELRKKDLAVNIPVYSVNNTISAINTTLMLGGFIISGKILLVTCGNLAETLANHVKANIITLYLPLSGADA